MTRYCSGVRIWRHSASLRVTARPCPLLSIPSRDPLSNKATSLRRSAATRIPIRSSSGVSRWRIIRRYPKSFRRIRCGRTCRPSRSACTGSAMTRPEHARGAVLHACSDRREIIGGAGSGVFATQFLHACPDYRKIVSDAGWAHVSSVSLVGVGSVAAANIIGPFTCAAHGISAPAKAMTKRLREAQD